MFFFWHWAGGCCLNAPNHQYWIYNGWKSMSYDNNGPSNQSWP